MAYAELGVILTGECNCAAENAIAQPCYENQGCFKVGEEQPNYVCAREYVVGKRNTTIADTNRYCKNASDQYENVYLITGAGICHTDGSFTPMILTCAKGVILCSACSCVPGQGLDCAPGSAFMGIAPYGSLVLPQCIETRVAVNTAVTGMHNVAFCSRTTAAGEPTSLVTATGACSDAGVFVPDCEMNKVIGTACSCTAGWAGDCGVGGACMLVGSAAACLTKVGPGLVRFAGANAIYCAADYIAGTAATLVTGLGYCGADGVFSASCLEGVVLAGTRTCACAEAVRSVAQACMRVAVGDTPRCITNRIEVGARTTIGNANAAFCSLGTTNDLPASLVTGAGACNSTGVFVPDCAVGEILGAFATAPAGLGRRSASAPRASCAPLVRSAWKTPASRPACGASRRGASTAPRARRSAHVAPRALAALSMARSGRPTAPDASGDAATTAASARRAATAPRGCTATRAPAPATAASYTAPPAPPRRPATSAPPASSLTLPRAPAAASRTAGLTRPAPATPGTSRAASRSARRRRISLPPGSAPRGAAWPGALKPARAAARCAGPAPPALAANACTCARGRSTASTATARRSAASAAPRTG